MHKRFLLRVELMRTGRDWFCVEMGRPGLASVSFCG